MCVCTCGGGLDEDDVVGFLGCLWEANGQRPQPVVVWGIRCLQATRTIMPRIKRISQITRVKKATQDVMPTCVLCNVSLLNEGRVCAPLGVLGDRCCESCSVSAVLPARKVAIEEKKKSVIADNLHIGKRMCRQYGMFQYDDDFPLSKSSRHSSELESDDKYIESESATDACSAGIEFELPAVLHGLTAAKCAVKPPYSQTRPDNLKIDILIGFDNTCSMQGSGRVGLMTTIKNFPALCTGMLKRAKIDDAVDAQRVRMSTCVHMFKFGQRATQFDGHAEFVPFTDDALSACCDSVTKNMHFDEQETNIELAVQYASEKAHVRFLETRDDDAHENTTRVICIVLLTDGSINAGNKCAKEIVANADARVFDSCRGKQLSFYAIGLGESTNPQFLTSFVRSGFWKHVENPHYPSSAFDITIGTVLASVCVYEVSINVQIERGGILIADERTTTVKDFGLATRDSYRARILDVFIPSAAIPGDVLVVNTQFANGEVMQSRIAVGTNEGATAIEGRNMSEGLFAEAREIEHALDKFKTSIKNRQNTQQLAETLIKTNEGSAVVQAQLQRYAEILDNSLSCTSSVGTMEFVTQSSFRGPLYQPTRAAITPSRWAIESSVSQLY